MELRSLWPYPLGMSGGGQGAVLLLFLPCSGGTC